jgi:oxygen-independent coproporphyrinogen-3 oxidase
MILDAGKLEKTASPFQAYAYAYPHKTAYRPLDPPVLLSTLWAKERRESLFLYVHVPFCEFRCGFCNLFTQARPREELVSRYMGALARQAARVREALGAASFARFAIGGGTPTHLDTASLEAIFDVAARFGADAVPASVEMSPDTVTQEKLRLLRSRGVTRASLGVQTFVEAEARAISRPQVTATVERALGWIREAGFPTLNVDLIYGLPGQTEATWLDSIRRALRFEPEELYLYPLYVRPLTGMGVADAVKSTAAWDEERLALLRAGRALLLEAGYEQVSLRMFRARGPGASEGPVYCCQEDGMVGLGCGARSYTSALHYSSEYAVGSRGVKEILERYVSADDAAFSVADYGFALDDEDRRRRHVIQSLLQVEGLDLAAYERRFGASVFRDLPALRELEALGWAVLDRGRLVLTGSGLERSDAIGPWLASPRVAALMAAYELH